MSTPVISLPKSPVNSTCSSGSCSNEHTHKTSKASMLMKVLEKISACVLGIFAALTNTELFVASFLFGVGIGVYNYFQSEKDEGHRHGVSACSQGVLEQWTGVRLPAFISLVANIAVTLCHIDHHSDVFVPIVGVSVGAWFGVTAMECGSLICRKFSHMNGGAIPALSV